MATIQELNEKVAAAAEKVAKIKVTIGKHEAAAAKKLAALAQYGITAENMEEKKWNGGAKGGGGSVHYWDICDVESKQGDVKGAARKLRDAETVLANWQAKLDVEIEKDRFLSEDAPAVIIEFMAKWKAQAFEWHVRGYARYVELKQTLKDLKEEAEAAYLVQYPDDRKWGWKYDAFMKEQKELGRTGTAIAMLGGTVATMGTYRTEEERLAYLERELERDRRNKLYDLIYRVNEVVGTITDASGLRISQKGNLDGIIVGDKGKAKIETIGAGGYNIQCFHFRTLLHEITEEAPKAPKVTKAPIAATLEVIDCGQAVALFEDMVNPPAVGKLGEQIKMNF